MNFQDLIMKIMKSRDEEDISYLFQQSCLKLISSLLTFEYSRSLSFNFFKEINSINIYKE